MSAIFSASHETLAAERAAIVAGIKERAAWELANKNGKALDDILSTLEKHAKRVSILNNMTLAYIAHNNSLLDDNLGTISYAGMYLSQRRGNQCFNEKAIPKVFIVAKCLNGGAFETSSDDETTQGVVLAIWNATLRGESIIMGHTIQAGLRDHMCRAGTGRVSYDGGAGTQTSSSLRALEALGIVARSDAKRWHIANNERFARMVAAAHGITYVAGEDSPYAPIPAPASVPDMPASDLVRDDASEDSALLESVLSEIDAPAPVLLLTHDPVPAVKAKRVRKAR